jgi:hypothetical protein
MRERRRIKWWGVGLEGSSAVYSRDSGRCEGIASRLGLWSTDLSTDMELSAGRKRLQWGHPGAVYRTTTCDLRIVVHSDQPPWRDDREREKEGGREGGR